MGRAHVLFNLVTDALEESDADDETWLVAAELILAGGSGPGRYVLRDVLATIDHDFHLTPRESKRLRKATEPVPDRARLDEVVLTPAELAEELMGVLGTHNAQEDAIFA